MFIIVFFEGVHFSFCFLFMHYLFYCGVCALQTNSHILSLHLPYNSHFVLCYCVWLFASIFFYLFVLWTCVLGLFDDAHRHIHSLSREGILCLHFVNRGQPCQISQPHTLDCDEI